MERWFGIPYQTGKYFKMNEKWVISKILNYFSRSTVSGVIRFSYFEFNHNVAEIAKFSPIFRSSKAKVANSPASSALARESQNSQIGENSPVLVTLWKNFRNQLIYANPRRTHLYATTFAPSRLNKWVSALRILEIALNFRIHNMAVE